MTKSQIVEIVGEDAFARACVDLRVAASDSNYGAVLRSPRLPESDLPHRIADLIWDGDDSWAAKISLLFEIYDDMPGYGHLMYVTHYYDSFAASDRLLWWRKVADRLAGGHPTIAQPIQYSLWCDFFENRNTVAEAWEHLTHPGAAEGVVKAVLKASGPVPYAKKRELYGRLIADSKWHASLLESLYASTVDVYGDIDKVDALNWLDRLTVDDAQRLDEVRRRLNETE
jgi:hypothetical protein